MKSVGNRKNESKVKEFEKSLQVVQKESNAMKAAILSLKSRKDAILSEINSLESEIENLSEQMRSS